jgi:hypothetical protein
LIDFNLAIKEWQEGPLGVQGKTSIKVFMAIGVLFGEKYSFRHDLESFFWVLFWICVYYKGLNKEGKPIQKFKKWNYIDTEELIELKKGCVAYKGDFIKTVEDYFMLYYQLLKPWVNRLRKVVFPKSGRQEKDDLELYFRIKKIL